MSKVGLVGPSYQERSLPFDAQRTVNLYPVLDQEGQEVSALYGTPGLQLFGTAGTGPVRGAFPSTTGRAFVVANSGFYEVNSDGTTTLYGNLLTDTSIVSMDENPTQLMVCDGTYGYIFTYATNAFVQITDTDFPSAGTVTFIDSYFVVNKNDTGSFYISANNDGTSWNALDFATAESSPDNLLRVLNAVGQLWLFGSKTTEIWTDSGANAFPFARISGAKLETGILAPQTAIPADNTVFWVGQDNYGNGIVYRAQGFTPQRISTDPIEKLIQAAPSPLTLRAYTYQQEGHAFYVITGGGMDTTLVYDISTQLWHERAYLNADGFYELHLASCAMYIFDKQLVGDRRNGNIYIMSLDVYDDNGDALCSDRIYTHLGEENQRFRYNTLEIYLENGVGTQTGQGVDPQIQMTLSKDGGRSWSKSYTKSMGKVGQYNTQIKFNRLGVAQTMTFRVRITDPVKRSLIGSYLH